MACLPKNRRRDRKDAPLRRRCCARCTRPSARSSCPAPRRWIWKCRRGEDGRRSARVSAFKGYHGFPAVLCTSVNSEVVHGIPSPTRVLNEGDIISIDCGVIVDGFYSDCAVTYAVGEPSAATEKLLDVTQTALEHAIREAQVGGRLGDISAAVQELCEGQGLGW